MSTIIEKVDDVLAFDVQQLQQAAVIWTRSRCIQKKLARAIFKTIHKWWFINNLLLLLLTIRGL